MKVVDAIARIGSRSTATTLPCNSSAAASRSGASTRSACQVSAASINAATLAASGVRPFPWLVATEREFGRTVTNTGRPIRSSPVMSASRVIPMTDLSGDSRLTIAPASVAGIAKRRRGGPVDGAQRIQLAPRIA